MTVDDLYVANKVVRFVKKHPLSLIFHNLGKEVAVVAWHDASLYSSLGVEITDLAEEPTQAFKDKLIFSQKGCVTGFVRKADLNRTTPVQTNFVAWKSRANKRVLESSFSAETQGATMAHGIGHHLRAVYVEISAGSWALRSPSFGWREHTPFAMITDCKSIFDSIRSSSHSVGDRSSTLNITLLRQLCVVGVGEASGEKAVLMWVPTRHQNADGLTKGSKCLEMHALLQSGTSIFHGKSAKEVRNSERDYGQC